MASLVVFVLSLLVFSVLMMGLMVTEVVLVLDTVGMVGRAAVTEVVLILDTVGKVGRAAATEVFMVCFGYGGEGGKGSCPVQKELITSKH